MKKEACTCWQGYGSADPPVRELLVDHLVRCRLMNECTRMHVHGAALVPHPLPFSTSCSLLCGSWCERAVCSSRAGREPPRQG